MSVLVVSTAEAAKTALIHTGGFATEDKAARLMNEF